MPCIRPVMETCRIAYRSVIPAATQCFIRINAGERLGCLPDRLWQRAGTQ